MASVSVFSMAALLVAVLAALATSFPAVDAKFSLSGLSSDNFQGKTSHRLSTLSTVQRKRNNPLAGHHPIIPGIPPCIPTKGLGHHPPGKGHHPPGAGGKPCAGHHPPATPPTGGHHPPGSGHHAVGGHHPPGHGHHCSGNASICLDPTKTPPGFTQCCHTGCRDLLTDGKHCGNCYNVCRGAAYTCCSGSCTDLMTNTAHCGSCGNVCGAGVTCTFGICGYV